MKEIQRWADAHQYASEPMPADARTGITVTLLNATPDPLGQIAALCAMYSGRVVRDYRELTREDRLQAFADMRATVLNGPLVTPGFHFLIEGVGRDFTHQAVRDSYSFIAQESLRLAVKEDWASEVPLPPSLAGRPDDDPQVRMWRKQLNAAEDAYAALVNNGMPAEDARKLLPHAVTTRYHWCPSLKTLLTEAGKRTCTQAQFEWRLFFAALSTALRTYRDKPNQDRTVGDYTEGGTPRNDAWQFQLIADALRPNCYQTGSCGFMAKFDRGCTIRERVEIRSRHSVPAPDSSNWHKPFLYYGPEGQTLTSPGIDPAEWATNPAAARA